MKPLVSIIIDNYNYAAFLPQAIDSALAQTYAPVEIVVVDGGSTDQSRKIIAGYGSKIVPVMKDNGGQASAFNAGVAQTCGDIICFLDSDDYFAPDKVAQIVAAFAKQDFRLKPMMIHHLLSIVGNTAGFPEGQLVGHIHDSPLNLYDFARRYRFISHQAGPTTSLSINRALANRLFPIPEDASRSSADVGQGSSADLFVVHGASLVGELYSLDVPLGFHRIHGRNAWATTCLRTPLAFNEAVDRYLNKILVETGRLPVMSFRNSMAYWTDLRLQRRWLALIGHIARLAVTQHDLNTAKFAYRSLLLALTGRGGQHIFTHDLNRAIPNQVQSGGCAASAGKTGGRRAPLSGSSAAAA